MTPAANMGGGVNGGTGRSAWRPSTSVSDQLRRRRAASSRCQPLDHCDHRHRDPLGCRAREPFPVSGLLQTWLLLHDYGLLNEDLDRMLRREAAEAKARGRWVG